MFSSDSNNDSNNELSSNEDLHIIEYYKNLNQNVLKDPEIISVTENQTQTQKEEDPLSKFLFKFAENLETVKVQKEKRKTKSKEFEKAALGFVSQLKNAFKTKTETAEISSISAIDIVSETNEIVQEIQEPTEETIIEEQISEIEKTEIEKPKEETSKNVYVNQLKSAEKLSKPAEKLNKISDVKSFIAKQITEQFNNFRKQYPNLGMSGSGGGTNAVQYAGGGTMDGDLNVTGKFLSGGRDLLEIFSSVNGSGGNSFSNKLIAGTNELILNNDGTITFPLSNTIAAPDNVVLKLKSENLLANAHTELALAPFGVLLYDQNSNSISFDSIENNISLTTLNNNEWKFNSEGILVGPQLSGVLAVSGLNSLGQILSGGIDLAELIQSIPQGPQGLQGEQGPQGPQGDPGLDGTNGTPGQSAYALWLEQPGNENKTEEEFLESLKSTIPGPQGEPGLDGANGAPVTDTEVRSLTANWQSTYSTVSSLSSFWGIGSIKNQYKSDYYGSSAVYIGSSIVGISESSPQWTIKKSIYSPSGTFISSISSVNIAWTNRYTL